MRCDICHKRKGKRLCPALENFICAECCGIKRKKEVNCPLHCQYLAKSKEYLLEKTLLEPEEKIRKTFPTFFQGLERIITEMRRNRIHNLTDRDVKEALEQSLSNLRIMKKGLIYEYKSPNPKVQFLVDTLSEFFSSICDACRKMTEDTYPKKSLQVKSLSSSPISPENIHLCENETSRKYELDTIIFLLRKEIEILDRLIEEKGRDTYYLDLISVMGVNKNEI